MQLVGEKKRFNSNFSRYCVENGKFSEKKKNLKGNYMERSIRIIATIFNDEKKFFKNSFYILCAFYLNFESLGNFVSCDLIYYYISF